MKRITFITIILSILSMPLWAIWDTRYHDCNQWELAISNYGIFGQTEEVSAGGFWPKGSGHNYIFGAGFDVGGIKPNGDTVVTIGYQPFNAAVEYAPGIAYSNPNDPQWHVYFSTDYNYPFTPISCQDGYAIYNDFDSLAHIPDSFMILGVTVTQKTLVFPIDWANDVVFFKYIVRNDTTFTINDVYLGISMDFDIGNEGATGNDRCGVDLSRKLFYGWQEQIEPGSPPWRPGMLGFKLLTPCSLSCFKTFTLGSEPDLDREWYLTMAGYDFQTGVYAPYDTIWPLPDDQRIVISSGPFNTFAPGDSIIIDWVLIASSDTLPPSSDLEYKADKAQICYETGWHIANVISPNGGEVIAGTYNITYSASSVTPNPLQIDLFLKSDIGTDTIAIGQSNTGTFSWDSALWPDGVCYRILIGVYDSLTFGSDISDDIFTIDNPGNAPPELTVLSPLESDTLFGNYNITWFARDPEFHDSLLINIYFKSQYDVTFQTIASDEPNDSIYTWNTVPHRNGAGTLIVETADEEFTIAETVYVYLLNQISGGPVNQIIGLNNCVDLAVFIHQPQNITGHTYELRFLQYRALLNETYYYPEYIYEITDSNTGVTVLDTYSLKDGCIFGSQALGIDDYSAIIDGFSMGAATQTNDIISMSNFRNDSVLVVIGSYPQDSIILLAPGPRTWWAYRGSRLQLDWISHANGGLTLLVSDLDYGDTIPYKPYSIIQNPDSAFGWCFREHFAGGTASDTLRVTDCWLMLCGERIGFSNSVPAPQFGDRWIVYPFGYAPPIKGNVYRFTPQVGINENKTQMSFISFQVYPVPFIKNLFITYTVPKRQNVKLVVYDVCGRRVKLFEDGIVEPGVHKIIWNGLDDKNRKAAAGVYFCRFVAEGTYTDTKKFILMK